ncbi:Target of rapamycin complex 1 subunit kog1 [Dipsacomyces acuminosporus]|nr:Target of rapamycin complex 1 subunit kog1 [Dipsacomyces acuminosporus]
MSIVMAFDKGAKLREIEVARIRHAAESVSGPLPQGKVSPEMIATLTTNVNAVLSSQMPVGSKQSGHSLSQQQQQQQQAAAPINPATMSLAMLPEMYREDIHFAATGADELLPTNPELPYDVFTSCLTTPVKMAVRFWVIRNPDSTRVSIEQCDRLPGSVQDRKTPLGELNWIFTSITDTIAWSTLPREQFRKLFRQDVVVASMYRNFMLADRIMRFYGVHPQCTPAIPPTHKHPLWDSLDLEIAMCLQQLPRLLKEIDVKQKRAEKAKKREQERVARAGRKGSRQYPVASMGKGAPGFTPPQFNKLEIAGSFNNMSYRHNPRVGLGGDLQNDEDDDSSSSSSDDDDVDVDVGMYFSQSEAGYRSSSYFSNQLHAFEVWIVHADAVVSQFVSGQGPNDMPRSLSTEPPPNLDPPEELPAVLQVLLSQQYRLRALILLYRFMKLGPWAVDQAMAVGIFPYMSKLLASTTTEIREILILVWARLSAVDMALQPELLKNNGFAYFVNYLANNIDKQYAEVNEEARLCDKVCSASAFTLTMLCRDTPAAQQSCFSERVLDFFLVYLQRPDNGTEERATLRAWILLCLAELWKGYPDAKWMAMTYRLCVIATKQQQQQQLLKEQQQQQQRRNGSSHHQQGGRAFANGNEYYEDNSASGTNAGSSQSFEELLASSVEDNTVDAKDAQDLLVQMAFHRSPCVRASAIYAMGTLLSDLAQLGDDPGVLLIIRKAERQMYALLLNAANDASPMVRREVVHTIGSAVFASYMPQTIEAVGRVVSEEAREQHRPAQHQQQASGETSEICIDLLLKLFKTLLDLTMDPHGDVALPARETCDTLVQCYVHSRAFFDTEAALDQALHRLEIARSANGQPPILKFLRTSASVGDELLGHPARSEQKDNTNQDDANQQHQQQQQQQAKLQRRMSAHSNFRGSAAILPSPRTREHANQGNASAQSHRYTMHFPSTSSGAAQQGSAGVFGERPPPGQALQSPKARKAPGLVHTSSMSKLTVDAQQGSRRRDRFAGLSDEEREEVARKIAEIERAWAEWGRRELRESICVSTLLDWAGAEFTEFDTSVYNYISVPVQASIALVESKEKARKIDRMVSSARVMSSAAGLRKWVDVTTVANNSVPATAVLMHPLEPHAIVACKNGDISVYDWELPAQVGHYKVALKPRTDAGAVIRSMHLVNPLGQARLLVGTNDGVVRIFATHAPDFDAPDSGKLPAFPRPRLLTAFNAVPWSSMTPVPLGSASANVITSSLRLRAFQQQQQQPLSVSSVSTFTNLDSGLQSRGRLSSFGTAAGGSALVTAWNQYSGILFAGSSDQMMRVWDIETEMCTQEIPIASSGGVTCISQDGASGHFFVVGNVNGVVRAVDRRIDSRSCIVASWREHENHAIRNVFMQPGQPSVISASEQGDVKYWDLRHRESVFTIVDTHPDRKLEHMVVHENAPVTLTASDATVKIWNQRGNNIGVVTATKHAFNSPASYMKSLAGYGPRTQTVRVNSVAMHPFLPIALMVSDDGRVSYIQPQKPSAKAVPSLASARANTVS